MEIRPKLSTIPPLANTQTTNQEFEVRLAFGPIEIGNTGDGSYNTLYSRKYAAFLDETSERLRLVVYDEDSGQWVEVVDGFPQPPHPVAEIRHLGVCFDQAARLVIAYEHNEDVYVYQWNPIVQDYVTRGPFPGVDPVLIQDATVGYYPPDSDILLFHLSRDRKALVMRAQRELYNTAHTIYTFTNPVLLDQAAVLPYQIELLGSELATPDATGYALRSDIYPVYISDNLGQAALSSPTTGTYIPIVVVYESEESIGISALSSPATGAYIPAVVIYESEESIGTSTLLSPTTGAYVLAVVVQNLEEALGSATLSSPTTGEYRLVVVVVDLTRPNYFPAGSENLGIATLSAPTTGSYDQA